MKLARAVLIGLSLSITSAKAISETNQSKQATRLALRNGGVIILHMRETKVLQHQGMGRPVRYVVADASNLEYIANYLATSEQKPLVYIKGLGTYIAVEQISTYSLIGREIGSGMPVIVTGYRVIL